MIKKSTIRLILEPIAIAIVLAILARAAIRLCTIPSTSMTPTLQVGDLIVVTRYVGEPSRGDVVVFRAPGHEHDLVVKRVIATPGDLIDARLGRVRIGGRTLPEPYLLSQGASGAIQEQVIPSGCYFVMGDNRGDSFDSRNWGVLPRDLIVGRARLVLWSAGDGDGVHAASAAPRSPALSVITRKPRLDRVFKWIE